MKSGFKSVVSLVILTLVGCAGVDNTSYLSHGVFKNQRTISNPKPFSPSHSRSFMEVCQPKANVVPLEPNYEDCEPDPEMKFATSSGYLDGLGAAALYSGAALGSSAILANGLKHSGSTTNIDGVSSSSSTSNATSSTTVKSHK